MVVTTRYGYTVRLPTILRKSTDTFGAAWREARELVVSELHRTDLRGPQEGTESEQIARKRVDHGHREPDDQPLIGADPTQPFGERSRQTDSWPAGGLDDPQQSKNALGQQGDQRQRVEHDC